MSDDTPTERFDPAGDAPTERIAAADTAEVPSEEVVEERKSRRLILILGIIGGALLIGVIILLVLLLTRGSGEPSALPTGSASATPSATPSVTPSATPSATPTPTPTPTETQAPPPPPPPDTSTKINAFSVQNEIFCNTQAPNPPSYELNFTWQTSNATQIFFGVATNDAQNNALFTNLPPSGSAQNDFPYPVEFPCPNESQTFTLTVLGPDGQKVSKTVEVVNVGDTQ